MQGKIAAALTAGALLATAVPALAATPTPTPTPTPKSGKWAGTTQIKIAGVNPVGVPYNVTQTVPVKFSVANASGGGRVVKGFTLGMFKVKCPPSQLDAKVFATSGVVSTVKPKVSDSGKFKFSQTVNGKTLKVSGAFTTKTQAKGSVSFKNTSGCATGTKSWTAKR